MRHSIHNNRSLNDSASINNSYNPTFISRNERIIFFNSPNNIQNQSTNEYSDSDEDLQINRNWNAEAHRQRLQRLFSTSLLICFLIIFYDNNRQEMAKRHYKSNINNNLDHFSSSKNITGIYSGKWQKINKNEYSANQNIFSNSSLLTPIIKNIYPTMNGDIQSPNPGINAFHQGSIWLFLQMKEGNGEKYLEKDISYVTGQAILRDEKSTFAATIFSVHGVYLQKENRLTIYGNRPDSTIVVLYPKFPDNNSLTSNNNDSETDLANASSFLDDIDIYDSSIDKENILKKYPQGAEIFYVSPQRQRNIVTRFRSPSAMTELCMYKMEFMVSIQGNKAKGSLTDHAEDTVKMTQVSKKSYKNQNFLLEGGLSSPTCGLYLNVTAGFEEENLLQFFSKGKAYAVFVSIICMFQVYFIMKQIKASNTQAAAAKISLITIGQQAILDSYLCLLHLTGGIIAQNIFTAFATVSFFKLVIFSIFEMRFLLIIWKSRRPQNFQDGWVTMRRELTSLYSRFYLTLLIGIIITYNFWSQINFLVLFVYSFWIPQIIHNAYREVKNPFEPSYLFGISITRLFIPIYIYGCPENFIRAFPLYHNEPNPTMCFILTFWLFLQVMILMCQRRYGARFFIPARFLPEVYNYKRKLGDKEYKQISCGDNDSMDCVICMLVIDIKTKEYMITPCDHLFHQKCLMEWMEIKMECPTCRQLLPPNV